MQLNQKLPHEEQITFLLWDTAENKSLHNRETESGIKNSSVIMPLPELSLNFGFSVISIR
ncbi:hypothetical protein RJD11_14220 [Bacillus velezensis]|uniref:hypothetical protein n=1 Tax=Bacillus TaxID=1386 RepID=UPI00059D3D32|nr:MULTISPECIES: hypothetical protein [Bacillus amyloliquefaciens group]MEC2352849.1 hypothetical protein [Bacillus velezensis]ODB65097.1 hypothetical protein A7313_02350 [Bacillus velezensis]QXP95865.1 hypothetical protein KVY05_13810 [Bacillus velezensis]UHH01729.1 hypothetical protein LUA14_14140 [Bacillus amyloliquefaciens]ULR21475.1 hypothetical protein MJE83_14135 [Bacillus velezensis]